MLGLRVRLGGLLLALLIGVSTPLGGCANFNALSRQQEIEIGEEAAPQFIEEAGGEVPSAEVRQYVSRIGQRVVEAIPPEQRRDMPWEFYVLDSAMLNAFALPGGKVFITRGMLEQLDSEAELAAVLAHEIGHVTSEHIGEQMTRQGLFEIGGQVVGAATESQLAQALFTVGGGLYNLHFSREQELEADRDGLRYMVNLGYDPQGMVRVLQVLEEGAQGGFMPEFLSTHPDPGNRLDQVQDLINRRYSEAYQNPQYRIETEAYEQNVIQPLSELPPPKHRPR